MAHSQKLFVISGPSGAGKGTLVARVRSERPQLGLTISATTRRPRPGERDGVDYHFLSDAEFSRRVEAGEFVEWACVHGNRYGTLVSEVDRLLAQGAAVILELDVQGALKVRSLYPDALLVFIEPPSMEVLARRLRGRGTEDESEVQVRLETADREMRYADQYDVRIVNDNLEEAVCQLESLIDGRETKGDHENGCDQSRD